MRDDRIQDISLYGCRDMDGDRLWLAAADVWKHGCVNGGDDADDIMLFGAGTRYTTAVARPRLTLGGRGTLIGKRQTSYTASLPAMLNFSYLP